MTPADLPRLSSEMRAVAESHPHNVAERPICPEECHRKIDFDGQTVDIVFSKDIFPGFGWAWHLSVTSEGELDFRKFTEAFFDSGEVVEITAELRRQVPAGLIPPGQRQFVQFKRV